MVLNFIGFLVFLMSRRRWFNLNIVLQKKLCSAEKALKASQLGRTLQEILDVTLELCIDSVLLVSLAFPGSQTMTEQFVYYFLEHYLVILNKFRFHFLFEDRYD